MVLVWKMMLTCNTIPGRLWAGQKTLDTLDLLATVARGHIGNCKHKYFLKKRKSYALQNIFPLIKVTKVQKKTKMPSSVIITHL